MSSNRRAVTRLSVFASLLALGFTATASFGQAASYAAPRVLGPVNEAQFSTLPNNVLPLAQPRFDRGRVPDGTPSGKMLMILKRSDEQQQALDALLAAQKDPTSPSYHKWLTPEQFAAQFGVADSDLQSVASYLAAQGFQVGRLFKNKMAIEFSGTTGQVNAAFRTEIHSYSVNGKSFNANARAPQIPAALAPVVKGITLNNFKPSAATSIQSMVLDRRMGKSHPLYTDTFNVSEAVSPGDLAVIYDIPPSATGSGVTVGVISDSNVNLSIAANYRTLFGLPASTPTVVVDGVDPGLTADANVTTAEIELIGATAPQASVNLYTAADTDLDTGFDFALLRAVNDNNAQVLVFGFESCEAALGPDFNPLVAAVWQQAAAQGISVIAGSGNGGAAECDAAVGGAQPPTAASHGLAVNGYASTPWNTAVGTTDFFYGPTGTVTLNNLGPLFQYWNVNNGGTAGFTSAKSYVPEQPWNESYQANNQVVFGSQVLGTGGGVSTVGNTDPNTGAQSAYPQPSYQAAVAGGVSTTARVIPDVSFFGANGGNGSYYMLCLDPADCVNGAPDSVQYSTGIGGSGMAASAFAGIAALVVQAHGVQGNLNDGLYATYAAAPSAFHDVTAGTNKVACTGGSPNCGGDGYTTGYNAGPGYDAASGLGSVDVAKLLANWQSGRGSGTVTVSIAVTKNGNPVKTFTHDDPTVNLVVTVAGGGAGTPTGNVALTRTAVGNPTQGILALTVDSTGHASWPYGDIAGLLPGGSYSVVARYEGDSNYAPAVGSTPVTVRKVASKLVMLTTSNVPLPIFNGQTVPYGTNVHFTLFATNAVDRSDPQSASGTVTLTDNGKRVTILPLDAEGFASFSSSRLAAGSHVFAATYSGDTTFTSSSLSGAAPSVVIGGVPTTTTLVASDSNVSFANSMVTLIATVTPNQACSPLAPCPTGAAPGGQVTFKTGTNVVLGTVTLGQGVNTGSAPSNSAVLTLARSTFALNSANSITASYAPDATGNYTASTSAPVTVTVGMGLGGVSTSTSISTTPAGATNFFNTSSLTFVATVNNTVSRRPIPTGTVTFFSNGTAFPPATVDAAGIAAFMVPQDGNGNLMLPLGASTIVGQYSGDSTHAPSSSTYKINVYSQGSTPDFAMQSNVTYRTISASSTRARFTLQFTSMNNLAGLGIPITLTAAGPATITCSGAPASPKFGASIYATVTYTCKPAAGVTVAGATAMPPARSGRFWMAGGGAALACVFLFGMPDRRRKWQSLLGSMVLVVVAFGLTGCGATVSTTDPGYRTIAAGTRHANASGTLTPGIYTVVVTGSANVLANGQDNTTVSIAHTIPLKIVVQ